MASENRLSFDDFKRWIKQHNEEHIMERPQHIGLIGLCVEPKVSIKKLVSKMTAESDLNELACDFKESGGVIREVDGKNFVIEVESGIFSIHRYYVKKA